MEVHTDGLENCVLKLKETIWGLEDTIEYLNKCKIPADDEYKEQFERNLKTISIYSEQTKGKIEQYKTDLENRIEKFKKAEARIQQISGQIDNEENINTATGSVTSAQSTRTNNFSEENVYTNDSKINAEEPSKIEDQNKDVIQPEDGKVNAEEPSNVENIQEDENIEVDVSVPEAQIEAVIDILYDEEVEPSNEEIQAIIEAIREINDTDILEGIDEDRANAIRAKIIQDALDGKIDLTEITPEELQSYIESQPSIKIEFEIDEAIDSFDNLIEEGIFTEEEINAIIENNIEFYDSEEAFIEAYNSIVGEQGDISQVEFFYDPTTGKIHALNTVDSVVITNAIITILGDDTIFFDETTGQVTHYTDVETIENVDINVPDSQIDNPKNITDVNIDGDNKKIEVSDNKNNT